VLTVGGGFLAWRYYYNRPPTIGSGTGTANLENDPLCAYVSDSLQLRCVVGLAAESVLGPGHFVAYPATATARTRVPFPDGDLFSTTCLVPGEHADTLLAALKQQEQQNTVTINEITYHLDRSFQAGAELPIPRLHDLTLKAGPKTTEVQDITMTAESAWIKVIDVNALLDVIANAGIRTRCLDNLIAGQYSVIAKALVAKGVKVVVKDKSGNSIGLSAAAKNGQLSITGGASATTDVDQTIKTTTATPAVLGVTFFKPEIFKMRPSLSESVVYAPSGQVALTVTGNGGQGALPSQTQTASLGNTAVINADGRESSECRGDFERTTSTARVAATARAIDSQSIEFALNGTIGGGHYATGTCIAGNLVGKVGHDNGTSAVATVTTYVRSIVRADTATQLELQTTDLPADAQLEVRDPRGDLLPATPGSKTYALRGAGVYIAQASWTLRRSVNGAGREQLAHRTTIKVLVR
jgi:hypothetical protein